MTAIHASFDSLLTQASDAASFSMGRAISRIDGIFGDGYARENPQLIVGFMRAAAIDMQAVTVAKVLGEAIEELASAVRSMQP